VKVISDKGSGNVARLRPAVAGPGRGRLMNDGVEAAATAEAATASYRP